TAAPEVAARRAGEVERSEREVRRGERRADVDLVPVAETQESDDREMGAGRLAAERETPREAVEEPECRVLAVVGRGGGRGLGGEPVVAADHRQAGRVGGRLERRILEIGGADRPAAAVEMQVGAARRSLRLDEADRDLPAAARDSLPPRLRQVHGRWEDAAA